MENSDHLHNGVVSFLYVGIAAVVFFNLARFGAAWLVTRTNPTVSGVGKAAGALVTFGA